jgi:hypothetical protein
MESAGWRSGEDWDRRDARQKAARGHAEPGNRLYKMITLLLNYASPWSSDELALEIG